MSQSRIKNISDTNDLEYLLRKKKNLLAFKKSISEILKFTNLEIGMERERLETLQDRQKPTEIRNSGKDKR